LNDGIGILKPDLVTVGTDVSGLSHLIAETGQDQENN